jgi:hypothetical protein
MAIMATTTSMKINRGAACRICRRRNYDLLRECFPAEIEQRCDFSSSFGAGSAAT